MTVNRKYYADNGVTIIDTIGPLLAKILELMEENAKDISEIKSILDKVRQLN